MLNGLSALLTPLFCQLLEESWTVLRFQESSAFPGFLVAVLEGRVTVTAGEQQAVLEPGGTVLIPAQVVHSIEKTGSRDAEWLIVSAAGVRFFAGNGDEMQPGWAK